MNRLTASFFELASASPDAPCVLWDDGAYTRNEVARLILRTAQSLENWGIKRGQRVVLLAGNEPLFFPFLLGAMDYGVWVLPVDMRLKPHEVLALLAHLGCHAVVASAAYHAMVPDSIPTYDLADILQSPDDKRRFTAQAEAGVILTTSGSTGLPKGVEIDVDALLARFECAAIAYGWAESDVYLAQLPAARGACLLHGCALFLRGAKLYMDPHFSPERMTDLIHRHGITVVDAMPLTWRMLLEQHSLCAEALRTLRLRMSTGDLTQPDLVSRLNERFGPTIVEYGTSETSGTLVGELCGDTVVMKPHPRYTIRLDDETGEMIISCPGMFRGYIGASETLDTPLKDGWWYSGDTARQSGVHSYELLGRKKEIIRRSGHTVYPAEVESVLRQHAAVLEAVVVGIKQEIVGELIAAAVVLRDPSVSPGQLIKWCREQLSPYKVPDIVRPFDDIPSVNSKADRKIIRTLIGEWAEGNGLL